MRTDKTRIRTLDELKSREKNFLEITNILERNNIPFFLQAGTVLGARREKYFIKWDWDVEIGIFDHDFIKNYDLLKKELLEKDFKILHEIKNAKDGKIDIYRGYDHYSTVFEILSWSYSKLSKKFYRWKINIPERFLKEVHYIDFLGKNLDAQDQLMII